MEFVVNPTLRLVEAEDIFTAVRIQIATYVTLKRGWKTTTRYFIVEDVFTETKHIKCAVKVLNSKGVQQDMLSIVSRTPVESQIVRSVYNGETIYCSDCGGSQWYYLGRSLFSYNYECAVCSKHISPCTESGASQ